MNILTLKLDDGRLLGDITNKDDADTVLIKLKYEISDLKFQLDQSWAASLDGDKASPQWLADTRAQLREAEALQDAVRLHHKKLKRDGITTTELIKYNILVEVIRNSVSDEQWKEWCAEQSRMIYLFNKGEYLPKRYADGVRPELRTI